MSKFMFKLAIVFFSYIALSYATPEKTSGGIALHIAKTHYLHPVRLTHPSLNVWHLRGPLAEQAAMASLQKHFPNVNECTAKSGANVVLLLEPHMFYNAQLRVFHAEYIARAYTSSGEPITRIKKQAAQLGALELAPDFYMNKGYTKAIDKIIKELADDQTFITALNKNSKINASAICNDLDKQPLEKLYY